MSWIFIISHLKKCLKCLLNWRTQKRNGYVIAHLISQACFFITLLLSLILIVLSFYELQASLWLCSIKVIGQCALFMSFGWASPASSSSPWRLGVQMPASPTITSQSITELRDRGDAGGGGGIRAKHTQIWTEEAKKSQVSLMSFWLLGSNTFDFETSVISN